MECRVGRAAASLLPPGEGESGRAMAVVMSRWIGMVALLGALAFFVTFFTVIDGPTEDSVFGYGFFLGFLTLAIWSIAMSIATYRTVAATAGESTNS